MQSFPGHKVPDSDWNKLWTGRVLKRFNSQIFDLLIIVITKGDFFHLVSHVGYHRDGTKGQKVCVWSYSFQQIPFI